MEESIWPVGQAASWLRKRLAQEKNRLTIGKECAREYVENRVKKYEKSKGKNRVEREALLGSVYPSPERARLNDCAEAFRAMAGLFEKMPCQRECLNDREIEELFARVQRKVCTDCPDAQRCWEQTYLQKSKLLYLMLQDIREGRKVKNRKLEESCLRSAVLTEAMNGAYRDARETLMWNNRMLEQRMAVGEQIRQTAGLLQRMTDEFAGMPALEKQIGRRLRRELGAYGIRLSAFRVFLMEKQRLEVYLSASADKDLCFSAKTMAQILSDCCREKMKPAWDCQAAAGAQPAVFHFVQETCFQVLCGISRITKTGELVSGDNYTLLQKDNGKLFMSLADGMGSGPDACQESMKVIELLEQFVEAGFPQETAVRMINSCLLLQNQNQIFSTIDLCMVDLYSGSCDLIKYGAATTFLLHGNEIEAIDSAAFPVGILQEADYESLHRQLRPGDSIIMMTDGVLEALPEENREQKMAELIGRMASPNAKEFARRLMEKVYLMQKLCAKDDMTLLIGNLWERQ